MTNRGTTGNEPLDRAIEALREGTGGAGLSSGARARIRQGLRAGQGAHREPLAALFVPFRRLALAAAAPISLVALTLAMMHGTTAPRQGAGEIRAHKQGDRVVFTIANGGRKHRVYRSTEPDRFDGSSPVIVRNGEFEDAAGNGPDLVFYRID